MRLNFKAILIATVTAIMAASCVEGTLELRRPGLEDVDATKVELTTLKASDAVRVRPFYVYELTLASADESVVLNARFASDVMQLNSATFTAADLANAHRNTFLIGNDGSTLTVGGAECPILSGNLKVTNDNGAYTVSGLVEVSVPEQKSSAYYELAWTGEAEAVKFPELPTQKMFTQLLAAESNLVNERNTVTVKLATDGVEADGTGNGEYLVAEFYSEDGYLAAGTYTPSKNPNNPKPGEYVIGYDGDFYNVGVDVENVGTCWWTVKDGVATAEKITAGDLYVAFDKKSKEFTIDIDNGVQFHRYVGAINALTQSTTKPGGGYTGLVFNNLLSSGVQDKYKQAVISISTGDAAGGFDWSTFQTVYTGTGRIWNLTIHAEGTDGDSPYIPTGEYKASDSTMDPFCWQVTGGQEGMVWGTYYTDIADGTPSTSESMTEGTIWVGAKNGEYIINYENGDTKFRYTGKLTGLVTPADDDGGYVGEPDDAGEAEFEGVALTQFGSFTDYKAQNGINLIGMELMTDGMSVEMEEMSWGEYTWMQAVIKGSGNHLKIEFYSEDGKLAPGTYTASVDPAALKEGEFGIGYDVVNDYGSYIYGTTWSTYTDGQVTNAEKVEDGTVVVEEDGGVYTITLLSSTVNARYEGPLQ